jgi:hypothetical protein
MAFIRTALLNYATNYGGLPLTGKSSGDPGLAAEELGEERRDLVIVVEDQDALGIHRLIPLR